MRKVLIVGSGFAGLWAALGAARRIDELALPPGAIEITVLSSTPHHDIRVRNYESDLSGCRLPLAALLDPAGVRHVLGTATTIDAVSRTVTARTAAGITTLGYDRLVLAAGSQVLLPDIPGLREFGFDVDTFDSAARLGRHLDSLSAEAPGANTVVVVGAGLTGIETACELPGRLSALFGTRSAPRVLLIDHNEVVGSDMGASARPVIEAALVECGVEALNGVAVSAVDAGSVTLSSGAVIATDTVIWCAGMRANPLAAQLPVTLDRLGRVPVDGRLRADGVADVFAAGDVAVVQVDAEHTSVMSCQHSRPMGRYAGYNVISDLAGEPLLTLQIPWYVTVLDLGPAGAVYTEGWDRTVAATGATAKATKTVINTERIYPPHTGGREALLAAAAPDLQTPPATGHDNSPST
ncbi:MAG: NAD(P)/FAD-dependent oxidoreductase [Mycobacterium sp.]